MKHLLTALLALVAALGIAGATHAATIASTWPVAACGSTITVAADDPGSGAAYLTGRQCQAGSPITIDLAGHKLTGPLRFRSVAGVYVKGGGSISTGYGVQFLRSRFVTIADMVMTGVKNGVVIDQTSDFKVLRITCRQFTTDCVDIGNGSNTGLISGVGCLDPRPLSPATHPDCIQLFSRAQYRPTGNITIQGNTASGLSQGFFAGNHVRIYRAGTTVWDRGLGAFRKLTVDENLSDGGFDNLRFIGNVATVAYSRGISASECRGCSYRQNIVATFAAPDANQARILDDSLTLDRRPGLDHCANRYDRFVTASGSVKPGWADQPCGSTP